MKKQALKRSSNILRNSTALTRPATLMSAIAAVALGGGSALALESDALPTGGKVVGGSATISQSNARMDINQSSNRTVIDWRSFDIGKDAQVNFDQPSASAIAVNRINGSTNPSQINGSLTANGQVWVLNPNGVMFGKNARIDVNGILASTARLDQHRFMAGDNRLEFTQGGTGSVINEGQISIRDGGMAAFVAPVVRNNGVIKAKLGRVALASGETFTLDLAGDRLVEIGLGSDIATTEQFGEILADGGVIEISAKAAGDVVDSLVNLNGITSAASAEVAGGKIILGGDTVQIAGTVDASGATGGGSIEIDGDVITTTATADLRADGLDTGDGGVIMAYANIEGKYSGSFSATGGANGGDGGFVETSGTKVGVSQDISVDTSAPQGDTGDWSIDPVHLIVSETGADVSEDTDTNFDDELTVSASSIVSNLDTTNVNLLATEIITINAEIDSSAQTNSNTLAIVDQDHNSDLTVNLNAEILLGDNQTLTGDATTVKVTSTGSIQNAMDVSSNTVDGAEVTIAAGTYNLTSAVVIDNTDITVTGEDGAIVTIGDDRAVAFSITANGVILQGMTITGSFSSPYTETDWDDSANHSTGINVAANLKGVALYNNTITNVRTGISVGAGTGIDIHRNTINNTKGSILLRTDGASLVGNSKGSIGNIGSEWDIVIFAGAGSGYLADPTINEAQYGADIMALSSNNDDMWVLDRRYGAGGFLADTPDIGNRSHVTVLAGSTVTAADDFGLGNGLGNERQPLATISEGVGAVVDGGVVTVQAGTYSEKVTVDKTVSILGAQNGTDARGRNSDTSVTSGVVNFASGGDEAVLAGAVVFTSESDGSTLSGMTILDGRSDVGEKAGVVIQQNATGITIEETIFTRTGEVDGDTYRGIVTFSNGAQTDLIIENNSFTGWATGVYLNPGATGAEVKDNDFTNNFVGLSNDGPDGLILTGNLFSGNVFEAVGIGPGGSTPSATISDNSFTDNTTNLALYTDLSVDVSTNIFDGVDASADSTTIDQLLTISEKIEDGTNSANGFAGHASLKDGYVFVTEGESINDGVGLASVGETIQVAAGTYSEDITVGVSDITLAGAQAGVDARNRSGDETIVEGGIILTSAGQGSIIDGLTIQDGTTNGGEKAGVFIERGVIDVEIQNTIFTRNGELGGNGEGYRGVVTYSNGGQTGLVIENNSFAGWATGVYLNPGATGAQILDNNFVANYVGVSNDGPDGTVITGNSFVDSGFEALGIGPGATNPSATISDNSFEDNAVDIGFYLGSDAEIDVSDNSFDGVEGSTASLNELFVIAANVKDGSDSANGYSGHASLKDGYVFVTEGESVSAGVGLAEAGDTVAVGAGTYEGVVTITKSIELSGQDGATLALDDSVTPSAIVSIRADDVTVDGFDFDGDGMHVGISIAGQSATVSNNDIQNVQTGIQTTTANVVGDNLISGNSISDSGYGISLQNNANTVTSNIIDVTTEGFGVGSAANVFIDNEVTVSTGGVLVQTYTTDDYAPLPGADIDLAAFLANNTANNAVYVTNDDADIVVQTLFNDIQSGVDAASDGNTVVASAGTYALESTLNIAKSIALSGQGEDSTILDGSDISGYGIYVTADDVSLSDFTLYGPSADTGTSRGIKVNPASTAAAPLEDFSIADVTIQGSGRAELDLNGVSGATITNVTANGYLVSDGVTETAGAGIQITDSDNVTLTGVTTMGNAWGGVALYQANRSYDLQVDNININAAENTFNEANGLYIQDSSDSQDFGTLNLTGFTHTVRNGEFRTASGLTDSDQFTFFQVGQQTAIDFALSLDESTASYVEGWSGTGSTGVLTVGAGSESGVLSIMTAINAAADGNTVKLLAGSYDESIILGRDFATSGLTISGDEILRSSITGGVRTLQTADIADMTFENLAITGVAESGNMVFDMDNTGLVTNLTLDNLLIDGEKVAGLHGFGGQNLAGDFSVTNSTFQNILGWSLMDMDPGNGEISNRQTITSIVFSNNTIQNSNGNVLLRGNKKAPTETVVAENNSFRSIGGNSGAVGDHRNGLSINNALDVTVSGNTFSEIGIGSFGTGHALLLGEGIVSTSITDNSFANSEMSFGLESAIEVDLSDNSFNGTDAADMTTAELLAVAATIDDGTNAANGYSGLAVLKEDHVFVTEGRSILAGVGLAAAGDTVVAGSATFAEDVADNKQVGFAFNDTVINSLTLNTAGSSLSGSVTANSGGFDFTADITLDGDTILTDTASAGVTTAAINGASAGGQSLDIVSEGAVALGSLGGTTRLGATDIDGGSITLDGAAYKANSLTFDGPVTVTQDLTVFETTQSDSAAGDITFNDDIFGSTDGGQSVSFLAGSGTGEAASNGTVSLQNAGTDTLALGDMTVNAHDFSAATVYLGGDFTSVQTGDLTFTDQTLNAGGNVTTDVGGDVTGPINSEGDVEVVAVGDVDSDISGGGVSVTSTEGAVDSDVIATEAVTVIAEEEVNVEVSTEGDVEVTSETSSVIALVETTETVSVTGAEDVTAETTGSEVTIESENAGVDALVEATEKVSVTAEEDVSVNASGTEVVIESVTSTVEADVEATDSVTVTAEEAVTGEINSTADVKVSSENANVNVDIDAEEDVVVVAKEEVEGTVSGSNVNLEGEDINSDVTAVNEAVLSGTNIDSTVTAETAIVEAEETVSGSVTADKVEVAATSVDVKVDAETALVEADTGSVTGTVENLVIEDGVLEVNGQNVVGDTESDFNQQIVVDFTLPQGVTVTDNGTLSMPDLMKIGVISPVEGSGAPEVLMVNDVRTLGEHLEQGYKAIVVNLDPNGGTGVVRPSEE